jgi:putative hemolysin
MTSAVIIDHHLTNPRPGDSMHSPRTSLGLATLVSSVLLTNACAGQGPTTSLANPASTHCQQQGGELTIRKRPDGGEYGVCLFEDNRQCEEWALFRGDCPAGGLKITGYENDAQIYCAITGGTVDMAAATCKTPQGTTCRLTAYFSGDCPSG